MTTVHVALADFLERARRFSFLVALALAAVAAHLAIPAADAGYVTVSFYGAGGHLYRGVYSSAWVGAQTAVLAAIYVPFFGFYLVRGSIEMDRRNGVGEIVAATPVHKLSYVMGKFLSNWTVLALIVACLVVAAGVIQVARGEDAHIDPRALVSPFILVTLPVLTFVAALAVLFDCTWRLRGTRGNVLYFILFVASLPLAFVTSPWLDWTGLHLMTSQLGSSGLVPGFSGRSSVVNVHFGTQIHPFTWDGLRWTPDALASRAMWVGLAIAAAAISAIGFERFDPAREPLGLRPAGPAPADLGVAAPTTGRRQVQLAPMGAPGRWRFGRVLAGELRLLVRGLPWWWYAVALGLIAGTGFAPMGAARQDVLPLAWIWPLASWSSLGSREERYGTRQLVFATAHPLARHLTAQWLAGVLVSMAVTGGMATRFMATGDLASVVGLWTGALAVPALALAAGTWTGSARLFEILLLIVWYVGVWQHEPALDYGATTSASAAVRAPGLVALLAALLLAAAVLGRRRRLLLD